MTSRRGLSSVTASVGISALYDARAMRNQVALVIVVVFAVGFASAQPVKRSPVNAEEFDQLFRNLRRVLGGEATLRRDAAGKPFIELKLSKCVN